MTTSRRIPIEHIPSETEVIPETDSALPPLTLLELVQAVDEVSDSEAEVLATVRYMMASGRIKLAPDALDAPDLFDSVRSHPVSPALS